MSQDSYFYSRSPENEIPPIVTPTLDPISKTRTTNVITLDRILGKGGYGTVYLCFDQDNQEMAVKSIETKNYGVPSLMEASIMSSLSHPYLSSAIKIHSTPSKLYIVQELAISDLKKYRIDNLVPDELCCKWIHMIGQGIKALHQNNLVHGDIKCSNILVYRTEIVKLSDFTLSTNLKWSKKYNPCTITHRPLEVLLGQDWGKPMDIWAFGCTVFELIYNKLLFVSQPKNACINAIIDWNRYLPVPFKSALTINFKDVFHYSFSLPTSFNISDPINHLILSMLRPNPSDRPTIDAVLKNIVFDGYSMSPYSIISFPSSELNKRTQNKVKKKINNILFNEIERHIGFEIYLKTVGMINANDTIKLETCCWISYKLVYRKNLNISILSFELFEILQMEREICNYLSYRFLSKTNQVKIIEK